MKNSICAYVTVLAGSILLYGCTDNSAKREPTAQERQEQLLNDPFGYKAREEKYDISGGGLTDFDKDAFKKDLDNVLNP